MKRKATEADIAISSNAPRSKKRQLTQWNFHLRNNASTEGIDKIYSDTLYVLKIVYVVILDGQQALKITKVYFNQKASGFYRGMSAADKEKLNKDTEELICNDSIRRD